MISYRLLLVTILTVLESNQSSCEDSFLLLCESQTENIFCQNNTAIEIAYASYGYNGNNTFARNKCDPFTWSWNRGTDSTRCHQQGSREILINVCHGRSECDVSASNEVFGDPCPGTSKYLEIFFSCTLDSLSEGLTSTPVISQSQSVTTFSDTSSENHQETELDSSALLSSGMFLYEFYALLCEDHKEIISCPNNTVIEIVYATYGYNGNSISARDKCDPRAWFWERGDDSTRCHFEFSSYVLINACNGRPECEVSASSDIFGDPCPGISKYLEIFYDCTLERLTWNPVIDQSHPMINIAYSTTPEDGQEKEMTTRVTENAKMFFSDFYSLLCEDQTETISCPNNTVIEIVHATYGYNGNSTFARDKCDPLAWWWERGTDSTRCHFEFSSDVLITTCNGLSECEVSASSDMFGDPCLGISKYLEIFYNCTSERPTSTPVITQSDQMTFSDSGTSKGGREEEVFGSVYDSYEIILSERYLVLCEDHKDIIRCPDNNNIKILYASFGYNGNNTSARDQCDPVRWWWERGTDGTMCLQQGSSEILMNACDGRSECAVSASIEVFGDPCPGISKYLDIFYICVLEPGRID